MALSRLKHGFESRWGRHFLLRAVNGGQVLERVGGYAGSNKLFSVERDTITEEQPLQPLLLIPSHLPAPSQFVHRIDIRIQGVFMDEDPCAFRVG